MKLQYKAWALVLVPVGLLTLAAGWVADKSIFETFAEMERGQAEVEGERARRMLAQQMDSLAATLKDYAYWGDAVEYVKGEKAEFQEENFTTDNMKYLRISEVLTLDLVGQPLSGLALDGTDTLAPMREEHIGLLRTLAAPVLADATGDTVVTAYHVADGHLYLVAVAAVRASAKSGTPPVGAFAMMRRFDQRELTNFSNVLMHTVSLSLVNMGRDGAQNRLNFLDDSRAEVRSVVVDQGGAPVAELVLALDRSLHLQGQSQARTAGLAVALTGFLMGALLVLMLDRLLLRRLQGMHADLKRITDQGSNGKGQVQVVGRDELSTLAQGLNRLLDRVRSDAAEQKSLYERQEVLQLQLMQSQKTEALGRFTSGIAHDFNNSLAAIGGWMRLADEDLDRNHPSHEALQQALKATRYANGIMRQLLTFSRQSMPRLEDLKVCLAHR